MLTEPIDTPLSDDEYEKRLLCDIVCRLHIVLDSPQLVSDSLHPIQSAFCNSMERDCLTRLELPR